MNKAKRKPSAQTTQKRRTGRARFAPGLNSRFTFNTFVVGQSNLMAFNASQLVAGSPGQPYNPLIIHGDAGLGKTHLMNAIGNHLSGVSEKQIHLVSAEAFKNDYYAAIQKGDLMMKFRNLHRNLDVFMIDSIQFLAGKERIQEEFLHTFNALHDAGKLIVITADQPPGKIEGLASCLVSRLEAGLSVGIDHPDRETCLAILRRKLNDMQTTISEDCLAYFATVADYSGRTLEGALIRAVSYRRLSGKDLTLSAIKRLLKDLSA